MSNLLEPMSRVRLLEYLADHVSGRKTGRPLLVGIDGIDCAGKTTLADELAARLSREGRHVIRAGIDGFHNPRSVRYRQGRHSAEGYYQDAFDFGALRTRLLEPLKVSSTFPLQIPTRVLDLQRDAPALDQPTVAEADSVLVFDGVFLFRSEIDKFWDVRVFVDVSLKTSVSRAQTRDAELMGGADGVVRRYSERYVPAQKRYLREARPRQRADIIIDNENPHSPTLLRPLGSPA